MKKFNLLLMALLMSTLLSAGNFVMIHYTDQIQLQQIFNDPNLIVHHYNNDVVFATAERFDSHTMTLIDADAFAENEVYTLVYCPQNEQQNYLNDGEALLQTSNFIVVKGSTIPYKNDGAVTIFNKKAQLPQRNRDFPVVTVVDPRIREMMDQVDMDSLQATVQHLQDYGSRFFNSNTAFTASDWIAGKMEALGLEVEQQGFYVSSWAGSGQAAPNVIGIQRGTLYPETYVVCGCHFDSFTWDVLYGGNNAPGADDNATGVASVLESARILSQYEFEYSIVYCTFGAEELGLYGSEAYASRCQQEGMDIIGYFNNDMNGYLNPGDEIHIDCIYPNSVAPIGNYYINVANVYFPEMQVQHVNFNEGDSDHTSFNNHGYMGIYPFEDYQNYSPHIHTTNDLIGPSVNSFAMSQRYCQMNIGCLTEIANPIGDTPVVECNPVRDFEIPIPISKELSEIVLSWRVPEEGSTGELEQFDVYRDNVVIASMDYDSSEEYYEYIDTITVGTSAEYFIMAVYNDGCEAPSETLIGEGFPTNTQEIAFSNIAIYPNPVENQLTIKSEGLRQIVIYNVMGQQIAAIETDQDETTVAMETYPKGIYTLKLVTDKGTINKNVIVK
jgi:hypothetical protein